MPIMNLMRRDCEAETESRRNRQYRRRKGLMAVREAPETPARATSFTPRSGRQPAARRSAPEAHTAGSAGVRSAGSWFILLRSMFSGGHRGMDAVDSPVVVEVLHFRTLQRVQRSAIGRIGVKPNIVQHGVSTRGKVFCAHIVLKVLLVATQDERRGGCKSIGRVPQRRAARAEVQWVAGL